MSQEPRIVTLGDALKNLCAGVKTQSQKHIRPLHSYCATRLVLEGGFPPGVGDSTARLFKRESE